MSTKVGTVNTLATGQLALPDRGSSAGLIIGP